MRNNPITEEAANEVYDALIEHAGCYRPPGGEHDDARASFVFDAVAGHWSEWRFQGCLGFGGKARWYGERFYVDCYPEDSNPKRDAVIETTNKALAAIFQKHYGSAQS